MDPRLKIDFVSPLPPVKSGIADYSQDLLPHLAELCDLRVIGLPGQPLSDDVVERWNPAPASQLGEDGRLPFYQMGNNIHHTEVWELAHREPGILTLHDVVLHHLLIELTLAKGDWDAYSERLIEDHGWVGEAVARARQWGEFGSAALFELAANRTLLRCQRGVLVHSAWAAAKIREDDSDIAVRVVPMGVPLPAPIDPAAGRPWREDKGIPLDVPLIGSFGFQTPIKRTDRAIVALAQECLDGVHLVIGGQISESLDLHKIALENDVADRVHFLGFLPFEEFELAIAASDICLNLRYPTAGETSASLLRVLALGRPVVVSDYAQFAELPDRIVGKVPIGEFEVGELATTVGELLAETSRLEEMGRAAREYVEREHAPERAAAAVIEACGDLAELDPPGRKKVELPAPTTLTWHSISGNLTVEGGDLPWEKGEERQLDIVLENTGLARWLAGSCGTGGVILEAQWRDETVVLQDERLWLDLPRDMSKGDSINLSIRIRRPLKFADSLLIEPHVVGVGGFGALDGPLFAHNVEEAEIESE